MSLITQYVSSFIRRLSVPHCEDCLFFKRHECLHPESYRLAKINKFELFDYLYANTMRDRDMPCGKRGKLFEPKEGA